MGSQVIQIIILAAIALFLILRLRNVLGTREGFERPEVKAPVPARRDRPFEVIEGGGVDPDIAHHADTESEAGRALAAMKQAEPGFSVTQFAHGSRAAYEMILMAFERGELEPVRPYLDPEVYGSFETAVEARRAKGLTVDATFAGVREVKLADARFDPATGEADITMRFLGELTSVVKDPQGRIVEGAPNELKQQRDVWTFSRKMGASDPNWILTGTAG